MRRDAGNAKYGETSSPCVLAYKTLKFPFSKIIMPGNYTMYPGPATVGLIKSDCFEYTLMLQNLKKMFAVLSGCDTVLSTCGREIEAAGMFGNQNFYFKKTFLGRQSNQCYNFIATRAKKIICHSCNKDLTLYNNV